MISSIKFKSFFTLLLTTLFIFLNSCSERSEYGLKSDYEKFGAVCTATTDTTSPTVSSMSPTDNSTGNAVTTSVALSFSEAMTTSSLTTNTSNTTCSGSFQLSADNFTTCIKMSADLITSNSNKTFTSTPADNLSSGTTYKLRSSTSAKDTSCNTLVSTYTTNGFTTSTSGSGTIKGSVISYSGSSALSGVGVSYALSGTTVDDATTDSSGDFTKSSLATGTFTLTYSNSGYVDETQSATLATNNQTLTVAKLKMLSTSCASTGTVSGTITDAVSSANVSGVAVSIRRGLSTTSGTVYTTAVNTNGSGAYSFSNVARGWYTLQTSKSGYSDSTSHVVSCGNVGSQDSSISTTMASGAMRIVLSWPTGSTAADLDSHLSVPNNDDNGTVHLYYGTNVGGVDANDYYVYGSDNATLDRDETTAPGTETISITAVKIGNYSFSIHDFTNKASTEISKLANSGATVKVYYNSTTTTYNPPSTAGTLWTVFTFTTSGGLVEVGTTSYVSDPANVY